MLANIVKGDFIVVYRYDITSASPSSSDNEKGTVIRRYSRWAVVEEIVVSSYHHSIESMYGGGRSINKSGEYPDYDTVEERIENYCNKWPELTVCVFEESRQNSNWYSSIEIPGVGSEYLTHEEDRDECSTNGEYGRLFHVLAFFIEGRRGVDYIIHEFGTADLSTVDFVEEYHKRLAEFESEGFVEESIRRAFVWDRKFPLFPAGFHVWEELAGVFYGIADLGAVRMMYLLGFDETSDDFKKISAIAGADEMLAKSMVCSILEGENRLLEIKNIFS